MCRDASSDLGILAAFCTCYMDLYAKAKSYDYWERELRTNSFSFLKPYVIRAMEEKSKTMLRPFVRRGVRGCLSADVLLDMLKDFDDKGEMQTADAWTFFSGILDSLEYKSDEETHLLQSQGHIGLARLLIARGARPMYLFPEHACHDDLPAFMELFLDTGLTRESSRMLTDPLVRHDDPARPDMSPELRAKVMACYNSPEFAATVEESDSLGLVQKPHEWDIEFVEYIAARYRMDEAFSWLARFETIRFADQHVRHEFGHGPEPLHTRHAAGLLSIPEARSLSLCGVTRETAEDLISTFIEPVYEVDDFRMMEVHYVPEHQRPRPPDEGETQCMLADLLVAPVLATPDFREHLTLSAVAMCSPDVMRRALEVMEDNAVSVLFYCLVLCDPYSSAAYSAAEVLRQRMYVFPHMPHYRLQSYHGAFDVSNTYYGQILHGHIVVDKPGVAFQRHGLHPDDTPPENRYGEIRSELNATASALCCARV